MIRRVFACSALLLATLHCHRRDDLRGLQLLSVVAPDATCAYAATNEPLSAGMFDPAVPGAGSYSLGLRLKNNLEGQVDLLSGFSGTTTTPAVESHPLQVQSVELCWYLAEQEQTLLTTTSGAPLLSCDTLPTSQRATITASGILDGGGGMGIVSFSILDLAQLRSVLGSSFSPADIPSVGKTPWVVPGSDGSTNVLTQYSFSPSDADAASTTRSAAWGEHYPKSAEARLIYQMRVQARGPGLSAVWSNWLNFPITICPKCVLAQCGTLVQKSCAKGPCSDGTPCLTTGQCANSTLTCSATTLYSGAVPDFGTTGMCLPAQRIAGSTPPTCAKVGCDL